VTENSGWNGGGPPWLELGAPHWPGANEPWPIAIDGTAVGSIANKETVEVAVGSSGAATGA
jgi:hypothetical protein